MWWCGSDGGGIISGGDNDGDNDIDADGGGVLVD